MGRGVRSALVVDDDPVVCSGIATFLRTKNLRVATAGSAAEAIRQLKGGRPDVLLLDVRLPDGDAFTVLEQSRKHAPAPIRIALSGAASPEESFRLGQYGVRRFLQKPVSLAEIWDAIRDAAEHPPDLAPHVAQLMGHRPMREVVAEVRGELLRQAIAVARGNRTAAARSLKVTRQAVQQYLRTIRDAVANR